MSYLHFSFHGVVYTETLLDLDYGVHKVSGKYSKSWQQGLERNIGHVVFALLISWGGRFIRNTFRLWCAQRILCSLSHINWFTLTHQDSSPPPSPDFSSAILIILRLRRRGIILYEANPMSGVFQNIDIDPPPPHRWVKRGWGVYSSEDARHCSVLYICKYFVACDDKHSHKPLPSSMKVGTRAFACRNLQLKPGYLCNLRNAWIGFDVKYLLQ
jgi:hypothetical protein